MPKNKPSPRRKSKSVSSSVRKANSIMKVSLPAARGVVERSRTPKNFRFTNRELISTIFGRSSWTCFDFIVNPGRVVCPWLSKFAGCFDMYKFHSLKFRYTPIAGSNLSCNIGLAFDYHCMDPVPLTEYDFSMTHCRVTGPCWTEIILPVDVSRFQLKEYYTACATDEVDPTFDVGRFLISVYGQASSTVGQLWVEYDVELREPQSPPVCSDIIIGDSHNGNVNSTNFPGPQTGSGWTSQSDTTLNLIRNSPLLSLGGAAFDYTTGNVTLPKGIDYALVHMEGTGNSVSGASFPTLGNLGSYLQCSNAYNAQLTNVLQDSVASPFNYGTSNTGAFAGSWLLKAIQPGVRTIFRPYLSGQFTSLLSALASRVHVTPLTADQYNNYFSLS